MEGNEVAALLQPRFTISPGSSPARWCLALRLRNIRVVLFGGIGLIGIVSAFACGGPGQPYAQSALENAVPNPWTSSGQFMGLTAFTAAELNRSHHGSHWGPITYVDADVASTRPDEVSVNPIDDFTWGLRPIRYVLTAAT